jgi:hypothetical protein
MTRCRSWVKPDATTTDEDTEIELCNGARLVARPRRACELDDMYMCIHATSACSSFSYLIGHGI